MSEAGRGLVGVLGEEVVCSGWARRGVSASSGFGIGGPTIGRLGPDAILGSKAGLTNSAPLKTIDPGVSLPIVRP